MSNSTEQWIEGIIKDLEDSVAMLERKIKEIESKEKGEVMGFKVANRNRRSIVFRVKRPMDLTVMFMDLFADTDNDKLAQRKANAQK
jgi:hypothetical protein